MYGNWKYDEYKQVGKDYGQRAEAEVYDASHAQFRDVAAENRSLIKKLGLGKDSKLIDLGAGTGDFAIAAALAGARVFALDVSKAMLAVARKKAAESALGDSVTFQLSGYLDFECPEERVDAVTSSFSLHHLPDYWKAVALERIRAALKPGGVLFVRDVVYLDEGAKDAVERFIETQASLGGAFLKDDAETHFREEFSTYEWIMEGLLQRAGFRIVCTDLEGEVVRTYLCKVS